MLPPGSPRRADLVKQASTFAALLLHSSLRLTLAGQDDAVSDALRDLLQCAKKMCYLPLTVAEMTNPTKTDKSKKKDKGARFTDAVTEEVLA